jgi:hypothetical protein
VPARSVGIQYRHTMMNWSRPLTAEMQSPQTATR